MSMFQQFGQRQSKSGAARESYTLNEILAIVHMSSVAGLDKESIAKLTGRSVHSLNYKIFEGKVTINGKTQVRSIRKHFYESTTDPNNNNQVDWETAVKKLFLEYKAEYKGEEDIEARIEEYRSTLQEVG